MQPINSEGAAVRWDGLLSPQQSPCWSRLDPSQSGYYNVQHETLNQWNIPQSVELNNGHCFGFPSHPVRRTDLPGSQQTLTRREAGPTSQNTHYNYGQYTLTPRSNVQSHNGQTFSRSSNSGAANLHSNQNPQAPFTGHQDQSAYSTPASYTGRCPNVIMQGQQWPPSHFRGNHQSLLSRTNVNPQDHENMTPFQNMNYTFSNASSVSSNASCVPNNNQAHGAFPPRYQPFSQQHNGKQTLRQLADQPQQTIPHVPVNQASPKIHHGTTNGVHPLAPSMATSLPPPYRAPHVTINQSRIQNMENLPQKSAVQASSYRAQLGLLSHNQKIPRVPTGPSSELIRPNPSSNRPSQGYVFQNQSEQFQNLSLLFQKRRQCNVEPQASNSMTGVLTRTSQDATSGTSAPSEVPHPGPSRYKNSLIKLLLLGKEGIHRHDSNPASPSSSISTAEAAESRGGQQLTTAGLSTRESGHPQRLTSVSDIPPNPSKIEKIGSSHTERTAVNESGHSSSLIAAGAERTSDGTQSSRLPNSQVECTQQTRGKEHGSTADCLELVVALQKVVHQACRAVAVVPPTPQQADPGQKEDATTTEGDSLPFKIDAVWTLAKDHEDVEMEEESPSLIKEINQELLSVTQPQAQENIKSGDDSMINLGSCKRPSSVSSSQSFDIPLTENGPLSKSPNSNTSQDPISLDKSSAKSPWQQNNTESSTDATFDLSTVPVSDFTLEKLQLLVKSLEATPAEMGQETVTDVRKCILDLYWGGDIRNLANEIKASEWKKIMSEMCIKLNQDVVLQFLERDKLNRLSCHFHILEKEVPLLAKEFTSSWLNVDGKPADIDQVLAEPISDYDFAWFKDASRSELNTPVDLVGSPPLCGNESGNLVEASRKRKPEINSDEQNVSSEVHLLGELVYSNPNKAFKLQKTSKMQDDIQEHHQENQQLQGIRHVSETSSRLTKSNETDCQKEEEKIKEAPPSKPGDGIDQKTQKDIKQSQTEWPVPTSHLSNSDGSCVSDGSCAKGDTSVNDSLLMDIEVLSSDNAATTFKDCAKQDKSPHLLQDDPKDLAVLLLSQPDHMQGKTEIWSQGPSSHIRFTCPHVTDIKIDADHFCPTCWNETPLLLLDLNEALFSPKEGRPDEVNSPVKPGDESCSPQPGKQTEDPVGALCPDKCIVTESIPDNDPKIARASPKLSPSPEPGSVYLENTKPVNEEICLDASSDQAESPKAVPSTETQEKGKPPHTKILPQSISSVKSQQCKKRRLSKSAAPADLFSPDFLLQPNSHKHHSGLQSFTPCCEGQSSSNDRKGKKREEICSPIKNKHSAQAQTNGMDVSPKPHAASDIKPAHPNNVVSPKSKHQECSAASDAGGKKDQKNLILLLYGSKSGERGYFHQYNHRQNPVYINVSSSADTKRIYDAEPSARQKVYNQWYDSFERGRVTSPSEKLQRSRETELKDRIEKLKKVLTDRRSILKSSNEFKKTPEASI